MTQILRGDGREGKAEGEIKYAQWDTWSWCHSSTKVGLISQKTELVFIGSWGVYVTAG